MERKHLAMATLLFLCVLSGLSPLLAQDPTKREKKSRPRCAEVHEAITARGITITSVRCQDGRYEIVPGPSCSAAQLAEAREIMEQVLRESASELVVDNLQDALVVIQFEPDNASARRVLKRRYDELKAATRGDSGR